MSYEPLMQAVKAARKAGYKVTDKEIADMIAALPERQAEAFRGFYLDEKTAGNKSAVGRAMGISDVRVGELLKLGRRNLAASLASRIPQQFLTSLLA